MSKTPCIIILTRGQWKAWQLDDPFRYQVALSAFYCGYGPNVISDLVKDPHGPEARDIVRVAPLLGMDESDKIITKELHDDSSHVRGHESH